MRYDDVYIGGLGVQLGQTVRTPAAVRRGLLTEDKARSTRQRSVCVAAESATDLAVAATRAALRTYDARPRLRGTRPTALGAHLHTTMDDQPGAWDAPADILERLPVAGRGMATATTANAMQILDIAATMMHARMDLDAVLLTAAAQFGPPRWDRYGSDYDVLYGDAAAAAVLARTGWARVLATGTVTDPSLAGYTHGLAPGAAPSPDTAQRRGELPVDLRARKAAWLAANGGVDEFLRRVGIGARDAVKAALADADLLIEDMRWVLVPNLGKSAVTAQWLDPLGIDEARTQTHLGLHLGHLGPADQLVALHHLAHTGQLDVGDHVLLAAAGAGITWAAAVVRIEVTP